jgi:hypothetical protein
MAILHHPAYERGKFSVPQKCPREEERSFHSRALQRIKDHLAALAEFMGRKHEGQLAPERRPANHRACNNLALIGDQIPGSDLGRAFRPG